MFSFRVRRSILLCLILAVGFTPAFSSACAMRCAASAAIGAMAMTHGSGDAAQHSTGGCHGTSTAPGDPGPSGSSAAMDAMCAFAGAAAMPVTAIPAMAAALPPLARTLRQTGESFIDQPPDPPPRA